MSRTGEGLVLRGVTAGYGRVDIVHGASMGPLRHGEVTALVGPNATGKSTLLRAIAGLVRTSGSITIDGEELVDSSVRAVARHVAFMPQDPPAPLDLSVLESVLSAIRAEGITSDADVTGLDAEERALSALERLSIVDLALSPLRKLSGGQRQLVGLAQTLVREPTALLLDEPTSALDLRYQVVVMRTVRELAREGRIVVIVLHDLTLAARWSDRIVVLDGGDIAVSAVPAEALQPEVLKRVYGVESRVERCSRGTIQVIVDDTGVEP